MIKTIRSLIALAFLVAGAEQAGAQNLLYRDTLFQNQTYCPAPSTYGWHWTKWKNFRGDMDTTLKYFTEVRMWGEVAQNNSVSSRTCTDRAVINKLADALKNGTAYVGTCNGFKWEVSAAGSCNSGSCSAPTSEVVHFACYPSSQSTGVCACGAQDYWVIRTTIQNANKGGVMVGTAGTTCNPASQWIELEFKVRPPVLLDVHTVGVVQPDLCTYKQDIKTRFRNGGRNSFDSFQYWLNINNTVTGPFKAKVKLAPNKDTVLTVSAGYTFTANTNYNISVWSKNPNNRLDSFALNDTAKLAFRFSGFKGTPNGIDTSVCGSQSVMLRAIPDKPSDSMAWYSDRALTQQVGRGRNYRTPYLASGVTYKYYVSSYSDFEKASLFLGQNPPAYGWPSSMFDIRTLGSDITVDSIGLNIYDFNFAPGTSLDAEVYIREGSWGDPGATTTASMWQKVYTGTLISQGSAKNSVLKASFPLKGGKSYGVYINPLQGGSNTILAKLGSFTFQNNDIRVSGGTLNQLNFGTALSGYTLEGEIFYKKLLCKSAPDSVTLVVKPAPYGARLTPGLPFQTSPKKSGSGAKGLPHVVALGDTLALELMEPVGYINADHGSKWKVASVNIKTSTGRAVTGYTWSDPTSGGAPGRLVYSPGSTEIDSQLVAEIRLQDLGPYFCDTVLNHYMYVAPLPQPNFTRNSKVCEGDVIEFDNTSTIQSGFLDYRWYFGDGDSSDAVEPLHQYPGGGTYYCKLNAISSIYGYVRTKIDTIVVTRLPVVDFKVFNVCEKQTHRFVNNTSATGTVTYKWNFGTAPGVQSTQKDPTFRYTVPGQYRVTLTAEANGCPASLTKNAYLFPKPKAAFSFPNAPGTKFCSNVAVPFTNNSTVSSGSIGQSWSFGDGEVGTVTNPNHLFKTGGSYDVRLIAITPFGCSDTTSRPIVVGSAPVVTWTNGQVCDQTPTQFNNGTAAISGFTSSPMWYFGDGATSGADNPQHQYTVLGPKTVKLVVSVNNGCKDSMSKTLSVGTQAIADFTAAATCSGKPVQFENKSTWKQGNATYEWEFGDGNTSNVADPVHTYTTSSSFVPNVKLKVTIDGACETVVTKPLQVYELPSCAFTVTDDWTPGEGYRTVRVQAVNTTYPFYRFKFSDGGSINAAGGVYQFPYEGDFTIQLTARNQADCECTQSQTKAIRNSVGTESLSAGQVRVYPNPSSGVLNVESGSQIRKIEVFNVLGETVQTGQSVSGQKAVIRFGEVSNGVYLVKVTTDQGVVTRRITVNK